MLAGLWVISSPNFLRTVDMFFFLQEKFTCFLTFQSYKNTKSKKSDETIYIYITFKAFSFFVYTLFIVFKNFKILITKHLFIDELYFGFFQTFENLIIEESSKVYRNITQGEVYVCLYVCLYVYMYICMYVYKYVT